MSPRSVLIIHADPQRRSEARALMGDHNVFEVANREQAMPLLSKGTLSFVLSQVPDFRRLLRDLERHTPGTPRAVLCPNDPDALELLSDLASEGYDFATVRENALDALKGLVESRGSARVVPTAPLRARFVALGTTFHAEVAEVGNDGLGLTLPLSAPIELLGPGQRLEQASVTGFPGEVLEPRSWVVRTLRNGNGCIHVGVSIEPQARLEGRGIKLQDEVRIRGLIRRAANREAPFSVRLSDDSRHREFAECTLDPSGRLVLANPRPGSVFTAGEIALVSFEFQGTQVEGATAVLEAAAAHRAPPRSTRSAAREARCRRPVLDSLSL